MPSRVYVGNLPGFVRERDVEDLFSKFGRIRQLDLKTPQRGAPYAFLEFDDERDADEAVYRRNGYDVEGCRLRVEFSRGGRGGGRDGGRDGAAGRGPPRRSDFRVVVSGLPRSASWQDLKDHMRRGGDIGYANTFGDGTGVVEYGSYEDMRSAIRKLDDSEFRNPWDKAFIRVREERGSDRRDGGGGRDRRRSRSRSPARRRRSRSGDRRRRSRSGDRRRRSRSRSAAKDESKADRSRSKSRGSAASGDKPKSRSRSGSRKASKSRSRSGSRKASKSRSRSGSRKASKSRSKSRSKSPAPAAKSASRSRSKSKSKSRSRSRSRS